MDRPPVQDARPPQRVIRLVNPVVKAVLRSPLHRLLSRNLMLLGVTGRRTGRSYTVPVGRHQLDDGTFVLSASGNWRHNLRGGADVRVTLDGRSRAAHASLEEDPERATEALKGMLERVGPRAIAMKVNLDRSPTAAEIRSALPDRGIAYLRLED